MATKLKTAERKKEMRQKRKQTKTKHYYHLHLPTQTVHLLSSPIQGPPSICRTRQSYSKTLRKFKLETGQSRALETRTFKYLEKATSQSLFKWTTNHPPESSKMSITCLALVPTFFRLLLLPTLDWKLASPKTWSPFIMVMNSY